MHSHENAIRNFRRRLVLAIRDGVLSAVAHPKGFSAETGIPVQELGTIADLRDDQRAALAKVMAWAVDEGIFHFLYGLDNQADGLEIRQFAQCLNEEGMYRMSDRSEALSAMSRFDQDGSPKAEG
jgi:hypothetical protein